MAGVDRIGDEGDGVNARQQAIATLLDAHEVATQQELRELLHGSGYDVTQATVSRDLERLGAMRVRRHGRLVYALPEPGGEPTDPVAQVVIGLGLVRTMEASGNLLVLRTGPGNAQPVAFAFDNAGIPEVIGTIAGDDTIALVAREPHSGHDLIEMIHKLKEQYT